VSAVELQIQLQELEAERCLASLGGLDRDAAYMADLAEEIAATHDSYVGAAVTEIAALRAELSEPQLG
jgi:hypothetical protein